MVQGQRVADAVGQAALDAIQDGQLAVRDIVQFALTGLVTALEVATDPARSDDQVCIW